MRIQLVTLGALRCVLNGNEVASLASQRHRLAVFLFLALERDTTRERVMSVFWPDREPERARHALSQTLYDLKRALGDGWLKVQGDHLIVSPVVEVDADVFESALKSDLARALAIYGGEFLRAEYLTDTNEFEDWVSNRRTKYAKLHRAARRDFLKRGTESADLLSAIGEARRWLELEPAEDEAHIRLIELLAATGQRTQALEQFEVYRRILSAEGLKPLEDTIEFVRRIRDGERETVTLPPAMALPNARNATEAVSVHSATDIPRTSSVLTRPERFATALSIAAMSRHRRTLIATGLIILFTVLATRTLSRVVSGQRVAAGPGGLSVGVLPVVNMSGDTAQEYFSDGLTEELITGLAVPGLRVPGRSSSFYFKRKDRTVPQVASELGVSAVLKTSVHRDGGRPRVTAQLFDGSDGYRLWAHNYRDVKDVIALVADIRRSVVRVLGVRPVEGAVPIRSASLRPEAAAAYDLFQHGNYYLHQGRPESFRHGVQLLEQAVSIDPALARAYAALAEAYITGSGILFIQRSGAQSRARVAAQKAIKLDSLLPEAHTALAAVLRSEQNDTAANMEYRQALRLNPKDPRTLAAYANLLEDQGYVDAAMTMMTRALEYDPLSPEFTYMLGTLHFASRHYEQAVGLYKTALKLDPTLTTWVFRYGEALVLTGRYDEAIIELQKPLHEARDRSVAALSGYRSRLGYAYAQAGRTQEARALLDTLELQGFYRHVAVIRVGLKEYRAALDALEQAFAHPERETELTVPLQRFLSENKFLDSIRSKPDFIRLQSKAHHESAKPRA